MTTINGKQFAKLIMITPGNNNKYYNMPENSNGTFTAEWGRVDVTSSTQDYPMSKWDRKYNEKIKKGYEDKTDLYLETETTDSTTSSFPSGKLAFNEPPDVVQFVMQLMAYADDSIKQNYTVTVSKVTQVQLDEVQKYLDELVAYTAVRPFVYAKFNEILLNIYKTLPRRMSNVKDYLLSTRTKATDMNNLIAAEQDLLDTMAGQYKSAKQMQAKTPTKSKTKGQNDKTLEELFGIKIEPTNKTDDDLIKKMLGPNANQFVRAFKVTNLETEEVSKKWYTKLKTNHGQHQAWTDNKLFWHGSRNQNWFSIITTGLTIRPAKAVRTGAMFGSLGTYFANKAQKSIGYTSLSGSYWSHGNDNRAYMGIYEVFLGRTKHITKWSSDCTTLCKDKLNKQGYDSVFAEKGADLRNDEYITYDDAQTTIRYIVEIK